MKLRNRLLRNAELALAMELRSAGIAWVHIAEGFSVDESSIRRAVLQAERYGMKPEQRFRPRHIKYRNAQALKAAPELRHRLR